MTDNNLSYHHTTDLPGNDTLEAIFTCMQGFMRETSVARWKEKLEHRQSILVQWVSDNNKVVAFKAGYILRPGLFYSWIGGVLPEYRRMGIAKKLLIEQHEHARKLGCTEIRTISTNSHKEMIICNLMHGFDILETKIRGDETRVVMTKRL